jgi:3D (Asp-Asp-Asp) domain-containing protein
VKYWNVKFRILLFTKKKDLTAILILVSMSLIAIGVCIGIAIGSKNTEITAPESDIHIVICIGEKPEYTSLGEFKVTAYCSCSECCGEYAENRPNGIVYGASGSELTPNLSIAVDPDVIPYGTKVYIDGREYIAQDTGGAIDGNRIDLYMSSHEEALEWGVQYCEVFVKEGLLYG